VWADRDGFLADPALELIGYQAFLEDLELGLFLFTHYPCGTTLAIRAGDFSDLHHGPIFAERLTSSDACPGYCLRERELQPCANHCECAWVRNVLQLVGGWPKAAS
jgi:hypothetical protein